MDFIRWGEEYLEEARVLKARVDVLRHQLKSAEPSQARDLNERIYILYSMYLDCRETGRLLKSFEKTRRDCHEE